MARLDLRIAALELQRQQSVQSLVDTYRHISPEQAAETYRCVMTSSCADGGRRAFADGIEAQQAYFAILG